MNFLATDFRATYRVVRPFRLPHHSGSLLRGVLGRALRRAGCAGVTPCPAECLAPSGCTYARLFDPPVPDPVPQRFLRGATRAPQPLIPVFPPPGRLELTEGQELSFGVRILGALHPGDADRLHLALEQIPSFPLGAAAGVVELAEIRQLGARQRPIDVRPGLPGEGRVRLIFETPVWLERKGVLVSAEQLDFPTLFRSHYRRLTTLAALHGTPDPEDDVAFASLSALAPEIRASERRLVPLLWQRHSLEQDVRHPMKGLAGSIVFEGPVGAFLPILHAAELVHVGKGTSHGLGRVRVERELDAPERGRQPA